MKENRMSDLINNPRIYSTVQVCLVERDSLEVTDNLYGEAAQYKDDIALAISRIRCEHYPYNDLMKYFRCEDKGLEASIKDKIQSAIITVRSREDTLYAAVDLDMAADLTEDEYEALQVHLEDEYDSGWGAEFALVNIETSSSEVVCMRLSHANLTFYTGAEFEAIFASQRSESAEAMLTKLDEMESHFLRSVDSLRAQIHKAAAIQQRTKPINNPYEDIPYAIKKLQELGDLMWAKPDVYIDWMQFAFELAENTDEKPSAIVDELCDAFRFALKKYGRDDTRTIFELDGAMLPNEIRSAAAFLHYGGSADVILKMAEDGAFESGVGAYEQDSNNGGMITPGM